MTEQTVADFYSETDIGRELLNRGGVRTMKSVLRARFGDLPGIEEVAESLARWNDQDAAIAAVSGASSLADVPLTENGAPA